MSTEIFPTIELTAEAFDTFRSSNFPLARRRALRRAIEQRCIVVGDLPSNTSGLEINRDGILRLSDAKDIIPERITDIDTWEDSSLGRPFDSTVLEQGKGVLAALRPALVSNALVHIIDPYLLPYERGGGRIYATGLKTILSHPSKVRAVNAITKLYDRNQFESSNRTRFRPRQRAVDIARWIQQNLDDTREVKVLLHERRDNHHGLHDRFIGFNSRAIVDSAWHALSIGYGLTAVTTGNRTLTCLARITAHHFLSAWRNAEKYCTWMVLRTRFCNEIGNWKRRERLGSDLFVYERIRYDSAPGNPRE